MNDTNKWGIPYEDLFKVADSAIFAEAQSIKESLGDPMTTWPTVKGFDFSPEMKLKLIDQMLKERDSGRRWDAMVKNRKSTTENKWVRGIWIISNWIQLTPGDEADVDEIGVSYFTDETAAEWVEAWFPSMSFTAKQFEHFRKKYDLIKVPPAFLMKGGVVNGRLKITHIGGVVA